MKLLLQRLDEISKDELNTVSARGLLYLLLGAKSQREKGKFSLKEIAKETGDSKQRILYVLKRFEKYIENLGNGNYRIGAVLYNKLSKFFEMV